MKRIFICMICVFAFRFSVEAQTVSGTVTGENGEQVEYAAVVLQTKDSVYLDFAYTDSAGHFSISIDRREYLLTVQHLMYETYEMNYSDEYEPVIKLKAKANTLGEIVVKGERPVLKLVDGKISYDMPLLLSGKTVNSAYESLLQLPGVREQNGTLALAGAGSVTVIINGRATSMPAENLMAALKMYPAEMISSAEIMYSAPPQYHVRGAVINLVMKGNDDSERLQGQINTTYAQKRHANHATGISFAIPSSKLTTDVNYAFNRNHAASETEMYSDHLFGGAVNRIEQFNTGNRKSDVHHIRVNMDFKPSATDRLNLVYMSQITAGIDNNESSNGTFSRSENHKENRSPAALHNVLAEYSSGFGLKAGAEYTLFYSHTGQHFIDRMTGRETEFTAVAKQQISRYRFFADQSHALPARWTLNYGAGYMKAGDRSSQIYDLAGMSNRNIDSRTTEYTANVYAGFEKKASERLSINASITGEYYAVGDFREWTAFPAMEITCFVTPSHIVQLSFSSDKTYPDYWEMHGAVSYLNGYGEIHGNPMLKPYRDYSSQLNFILKGKYVFTAFYSYIDRYAVQLPYQAHDRLALVYKTMNFDYKQTAGMNIILPFSIIRSLKSSLTLSGFYDRVKSEHGFQDIAFTNDNFAIYARLDNTVNISSKPDIKMEIVGAYMTKNIQGPMELTRLWNVDIGMKWTFFHNMAELKLKATDLFNSWSPNMIMNYSAQNLRINIIPDSKSVSLSLVFKLGGYDKKYKNPDSSRFGTK